MSYPRPCLLFVNYTKSMHKSELKFEGILATFIFLAGFTFFYFIRLDLPVVWVPEEGFDKPAFLAREVGALFTPLLSHKITASWLLSSCLLIQWWLATNVIKKFRVGNMASVYALFPAAIIWILYSGPVSLASAFSFIILLCAFLLYTPIHSLRLSIAAGFLLLPAVYLLAGARLICLVLLILLYEDLHGRRRWFYWSMLALAAFFVPECMNFYYRLGEKAYLYPYVVLASVLPGICLCFGLLLLRVHYFRRIRLSPLNLSVSLLLFILLLISGMRLHQSAKEPENADPILTRHFVQPGSHR